MKIKAFNSVPFIFQSTNGEIRLLQVWDHGEVRGLKTRKPYGRYPVKKPPTGTHDDPGRENRAAHNMLRRDMGSSLPEERRDLPAEQRSEKNIGAGIIMFFPVILG